MLGRRQARRGVLCASGCAAASERVQPAEAVRLDDVTVFVRDDGDCLADHVAHHGEGGVAAVVGQVRVEIHRHALSRVHVHDHVGEGHVDLSPAGRLLHLRHFQLGVHFHVHLLLHFHALHDGNLGALVHVHVLNVSRSDIVLGLEQGRGAAPVDFVVGDDQVPAQA